METTGEEMATPSATESDTVPTRATRTLREQIARVALLRRQATVFGAAMQRIREQFEQQHADEFQMLADLKAELGAEEQRLRQLTIEAYEQTGDKKPAPGVSIRALTELVYDPTQAFAWAKERGLALQLDTKAFEAIAKVTALDFVAKREAPQATLARELPIDALDVLDESGAAAPMSAGSPAEGSTAEVAS
jgi:hypothetical protein